jgi:hypothetical protein
MVNLWPEDIAILLKEYPLPILREQARYLVKRANRLKGRVETKQVDNDKLRHTMVISAQKHEYFRFPLFYIEHVLEGWPVEFYAPILKPGFTVTNVSDFREALRVILNSKTVKLTISNLQSMCDMAQ